MSFLGRLRTSINAIDFAADPERIRSFFGRFVLRIDRVLAARSAGTREWPARTSVRRNLDALAICSEETGGSECDPPAR